MATNSYVQVPPDSTGKKLHAQQHTVDAAAVQVPAYHLVDHEDATYGQKVDVRGQAYTRFAEGSPSMDAFGNLRIGEAYCVGSYDYAHGDASDLFQDLNTTGGSITHNPSTSDTTLAVTTNTSASISRTTVRYHHYQPGVSNLIIQTLVHGDAGKANHRRKWGYFDADYGLYWELDGTTLYAVIKSDTLGQTFRVAQADWNQDKLNGTGISGMDLDITKANFYFVDFAWLGVGEVRFGVLGPNGERNICHIFQNPNALVAAYMHAGCAPLRWEMENYGVVGSSSEMRAICSAVYSQSRVDYTFWRFSDIGNTAGVALTTGQSKPLFSMRVAAGNHIGVYPESINTAVVGTGAIIKFSIVDDATLTGGAWTSAGSVVEQNNSATALSGGSEFHAFWCAEGAKHEEVANVYELNDEGYHRFPDDSGGYTFTLVATLIAGASATVYGDLTYRELR